jgi:hypothetical protein
MAHVTADYPPGSFGYECDRLDGELERLTATAPWPIRVWARRKRQRLAAARQKVRDRSIETLVREGYIEC